MASPTLGAVSPAEFIPIAEAAGLIDQIGMLVLRRACFDGLAWPDIMVSVNLSPVQLRNPDLVNRVKISLPRLAPPPLVWSWK